LSNSFRKYFIAFLALLALLYVLNKSEGETLQDIANTIQGRLNSAERQYSDKLSDSEFLSAIRTADIENPVLHKALRSRHTG
jgi:hypothetical protein